ncbi:MAG: hypothetical protein V4671_18975, partial [Armatimonadota bacterium]
MKLTVFGKLKRGSSPIKWDDFKEVFQNKFGGSVLHNSAVKAEFSFTWVGTSFEEIISAAESGSLDSFVQTHGMGQIKEILINGGCYYQAIPKVPSRPPRLLDVSTDDLKQAIHQVDVLLLTATELERQAVHTAMDP